MVGVEIHCDICFKLKVSDESIKSGIIGSVTDAAWNYIEYVGFNKNLTAIIDALEQRRADY